MGLSLLVHSLRDTYGHLKRFVLVNYDVRYVVHVTYDVVANLKGSSKEISMTVIKMCRRL